MKLKWLHCTRCGSLQHPAAYLCSVCLASELVWRPIPADGRVASWTRLHTSADPLFQNLLPWTVVSVTLTVGPTVIAHWVGDSTPEICTRIVLIPIVDPVGRNVFAAVPYGSDPAKAERLFSAAHPTPERQPLT